MFRAVTHLFLSILIMSHHLLDEISENSNKSTKCRQPRYIEFTVIYNNRIVANPFLSIDIILRAVKLTC